MEVIPVINCADAECVREKLAAAKQFLPEGSFVHLDVTDGVFAAHKTWNDPLAWVGLQASAGTSFNLEVHLMVARPEEYVEPWLDAAGAKRLIVHAEALAREDAAEENIKIAEGIMQKCAERGAELMLASTPDTPPAALAPWIPRFQRFQVLAVHPGPAAQEFLPASLEKIRMVRAAASGDAIIEVDGGMNLETARAVKDAGANVIVSSTYIFGAADPKAAYEALRNI